MSRSNRLLNGSPVRFDTAQGWATGRGAVADACYDDGWLYRLDNVAAAASVDDQRNEHGELWAWDFEVFPIDETRAPRTE